MFQILDYEKEKFIAVITGKVLNELYKGLEQDLVAEELLKNIETELRKTFDDGQYQVY